MIVYLDTNIVIYWERANMERLEIEAVYENGALRLSRELPLRQGQKVTITIHVPETAAQRLRGLIRWKGSQEDLDYLLGPDNTPWAGKDE